jgi:hypothetical protein
MGGKSKDTKEGYWDEPTYSVITFYGTLVSSQGSLIGVGNTPYALMSVGVIQKPKLPCTGEDDMQTG